MDKECSSDNCNKCFKCGKEDKVYLTVKEVKELIKVLQDSIKE